MISTEKTNFKCCKKKCNDRTARARFPIPIRAPALRRSKCSARQGDNDVYVDDGDGENGDDDHEGGDDDDEATTTKLAMATTMTMRATTTALRPALAQSLTLTVASSTFKAPGRR